MKIIRSLLVATTLFAVSGLAIAAPDHDHGHGHGHDRDRYEQHDHGRHGGWDRDDDRGWDHDRGHHYGEYRHGHRHWERGHRYDGPVYVVHDYGRYRLRPPPRGYHWVRDDDGQYLLVAVATGIILDMVLH